MLGFGFFAWALQHTTDLLLTRRLLIAHYFHDILGCYVAYNASFVGELSRIRWAGVLTYGAFAVTSIVLYKNTTMKISAL